MVLSLFLFVVCLLFWLCFFFFFEGKRSKFDISLVNDISSAQYTFFPVKRKVCSELLSVYRAGFGEAKDHMALKHFRAR